MAQTVFQGYADVLSVGKSTQEEDRFSSQGGLLLDEDY